MIEDQVFRDPSVKDQDSYRAILDGVLLPHNWNSPGAARAGLEVETLRAQRRSKEQING